MPAPLEEVFSKLKYFLKANDNAYLCTSSPEDMVKLAFSTACIEKGLVQDKKQQFFVVLVCSYT